MKWQPPGLARNGARAFDRALVPTPAWELTPSIVTTRRHIHSEEFPRPDVEIFAILHTPSAIRGWWGASRAIVLPQKGGVWAAVWGEDENAPEYITAARMTVFDPPRRLMLANFQYHARSGPLPFQAEMTTEFQVEARPGGCQLRVVQEGFPLDASADAFYDGCKQGWENTFAGIRKYLGLTMRT